MALTRAARSADRERVQPVEFRPFTSEERRVLEGFASGRGAYSSDVLLALVVFVFAFGLEIGGLKLVGAEPRGAVVWIPVGLAALVAVGTFVYVRRDLARGLRAEREACAADLDAGRAVTRTFEVVAALGIEEFEDEGSSYYLELADGSVLFLSGQYLYEPEEQGSFPSTRFALTRAPRSGIVFAVECLGQPLPVSAKRPPFSPEEHRAGRVPEDGALLHVDFECLRGT